MTLQTEPQYKLRLSQELKNKINVSAKKHNRSMNADIIARLEDSFVDKEKIFNITSSLVVASIFEELVNSGLFSADEAQQLIDTATANSIKPEFVKKYYTLEDN